MKVRVILFAFSGTMYVVSYLDEYYRVPAHLLEDIDSTSAYIDSRALTQDRITYLQRR